MSVFFVRGLGFLGFAGQVDIDCYYGPSTKFGQEQEAQPHLRTSNSLAAPSLSSPVLTGLIQASPL